MTLRLRNLLWMIPLGLFILSPIWMPGATAFLKPRGGYDPELAKMAGQVGRNFVMNSVKITLSSNGRIEWVITAERAFTGETDKEIKMEAVHAVHYGVNGQETFIVSDTGTYLVDARHLTLTDNVVITKPSEQQEMYTDLLHYYDDRKIVSSPGAVEIRSPKFTIQAGGMDYDLSTDGYDFSKRVHCQF